MRRSLLSILLIVVSHLSMADSDTVELNKKLVIDFYNEVIVNGNYQVIDEYVGDVYIQHNPNVRDGKEALVELVKSFPPREKDAPPAAEIVRVIAEDDLVVLHTKHNYFPPPNGGAIVDIYRVENNKIVEHWDVVQAIPETSLNENTMF